MFSLFHLSGRLCLFYLPISIWVHFLNSTKTLFTILTICQVCLIFPDQCHMIHFWPSLFHSLYNVYVLGQFYLNGKMDDMNTNYKKYMPRDFKSRPFCGVVNIQTKTVSAVKTKVFPFIWVEGSAFWLHWCRLQGCPLKTQRCVTEVLSSFGKMQPEPRCSCQSHTQIGHRQPEMSLKLQWFEREERVESRGSEWDRGSTVIGKLVNRRKKKLLSDCFTVVMFTPHPHTLPQCWILSECTP